MRLTEGRGGSCISSTCLARWSWRTEQETGVLLLQVVLFLLSPSCPPAAPLLPLPTDPLKSGDSRGQQALLCCSTIPDLLVCLCPSRLDHELFKSHSSTSDYVKETCGYGESDNGNVVI